MTVFLTASHHIFSIRTAIVCGLTIVSHHYRHIFLKYVALRSHASASHRGFFCSFLDGVIIAYVHNLLEIKTSRASFKVL